MYSSYTTTTVIYAYNIAMHAYVLAHKPAHALPTAGFHLVKFAVVILYFAETVAQVSPLATKWKVLQLVVIPVWYGVGVATPLPGLVVVAGALVVVVVGVCPTVEMHTYYNKKLANCSR